MKYIAFFISLASVLMLSGCAQDDLIRSEGPSLTAGNALAVNSALQMVDPWPVGVEDNDLTVPSDRGEGGEEGTGSTKPGSSSATATTNP